MCTCVAPLLALQVARVIGITRVTGYYAFAQKRRTGQMRNMMEANSSSDTRKARGARARALSLSLSLSLSLAVPRHDPQGLLLRILQR